MKWQPIETAPKDGSIVLLRLTPHCVVSGQNDLELLGATAPRDEWWHIAPDDISYPLVNAPTHWMPLPAPPETEK